MGKSTAGATSRLRGIADKLDEATEAPAQKKVSRGGQTVAVRLSWEQFTALEKLEAGLRASSPVLINRSDALRCVVELGLPAALKRYAR